jgi:hypothetical protein
MKKSLASTFILRCSVAIVAAIVLFSAPAYSQQYEWSWGAGDEFQTYFEDVDVDTDGNILIAGEFWRTVDFDPGPGLDTLRATGNGVDGFVMKLDSSHQLIWAKQISGTVTDYIYYLSVDGQGNAIYSGPVYAIQDLDPGVGTLTADAYNGDRAHISKLDPNGNLLWAALLHCNNGPHGAIRSLTVDAQDNVIVTGTYSGTVDFDPGAGTFLLTAASAKGFVWKLNSQGQFLWVKEFDNTFLSGSTTVEVTSQQEIVVAGSFTDTVDFDPGTNSFPLIASGTASDVVLLKLDAAGNFVWAKSFRSTGVEITYGAKLAGGDTIFCMIRNDSAIDLDPGTGVYYVGGPTMGLAMVKLDPSGNFVWGTATGWDQVGHKPNGWTISENSVWVAGKFTSPIDFDHGTGSQILNPIGTDDAFLLRFGTDGVFQSVVQFGGVDAFAKPFALEEDDLGNIFMAGQFRDTVDFDPGTAIANLNTGANNTFGFIVQLQDPTFATSIESGSPLQNAHLFPNPNQGEFRVDFGDVLENAQVFVLNSTGTVVHQSWITIGSEWKTSLDLPSGIYTVQVVGEKQFHLSKLIIVND